MRDRLPGILGRSRESEGLGTVKRSGEADFALFVGMDL